LLDDLPYVCRMTRSLRANAAALIAVVTLALLLTACSSGSHFFGETGRADAPTRMPSPAGSAPADSQPGGGIPWNEALSHAGTTQRVCGPLVGTGHSGNDVFLDLGLDYPDLGRFQIVVWDVGSLDPIDGGVTVCATGPITLYNGVPEIQLTDPKGIETYE
jgi:hypothetical protein